MTAREVLASNIVRLRQARGWSQERLAEECGLHRTYIGDVERGNRNIGVDNVERVADALGVSVADLLTSHRDRRR